jgi:hypothetical protein
MLSIAGAAAVYLVTAEPGASPHPPAPQPGGELTGANAPALVGASSGPLGDGS